MPRFDYSTNEWGEIVIYDRKPGQVIRPLAKAVDRDAAERIIAALRACDDILPLIKQAAA